MHTTWYILEDGSAADPDDVAPDASGVLRHKSGIAVAVGPHGPRSRGMSENDIAAARVRTAAPEERASRSPNDRQMKPKSGAGYHTR